MKPLYLLLLAAAAARQNLIFMISDGFGLTSETMARAYMQAHGEPWSSLLDSMLTGTVRTQSASSLVTDSAAGATAFACGIKSYNGAIAVDPQGAPCGTIVEAAKNRGYSTGLVTTARITHATPAAFAAHVADRDMEDLIAIQLLAQNATTQKPTVDLMLGGGLCHFLPQSHAQSCRGDDTDVWLAAQRSGFSTLTNRREFDALSASSRLPLMGLFAPSHMAYEIDRNPSDQPSLAEMTQRALDILGKQSPDGFFLMVEGARIDMAGHDNDPAAHLRDIIEYWRTVNIVRQFVITHPDTLVVSTSDHETGGLTLGIDPEYLWRPELLKPITKSAESLCAHLHKLRKSQPSDVSEFISSTMLPEYLGIHNATDNEVEEIAQVLDNDKGHKRCKRTIGNVVSRRAHIGWSTGGHTGTDVGLYAFGHRADEFRGCMENTQLGRRLMQYLDVNPVEITKQLADIPTKQHAFVYRPHHDHD
ncbi:vacuolar alkaline phosphatase [Coemansia sp. RSA 2708]|nr:vacuolar alkaline phosphatase [Coemansia sp. RSA 2708]